MNNPTFYETVAHSPQWQAWVKYNEENMSNEEVKCFDVHESMETGWLSDNHFQEFIEYCYSNNRSSFQSK